MIVYFILFYFLVKVLMNWTWIINIQPYSSTHDVTFPLGLGPLEKELNGLIYERQMLTGAVRLPLRLWGMEQKAC